ncbi:large ribosomal subunit protein mL53 [Parasteatoda tepidariorum]|uniref:large ribosomal subunit protein mL53 n=1 Tax=Parasteatoda tepidariorum TaxID=114398 RepID=UPI00077FD33D|nr:39S ribosomal protein L53, mitochondrial [Parasteatoda tepidariorum]
MAIRLRDSAFKCLFTEVKKFHLRPVKKLSFQFDPFHENAKSVRDFLFHISTRRIRKTSDICIIKTDVVNDRSEPTINVELTNGLHILFKCANLSTLDVAREYNKLMDKYDVQEEESTLKLKGALQKDYSKKKK